MIELAKKKIEYANLQLDNNNHIIAEQLYREILHTILQAYYYDQNNNKIRKFLHRTGQVIHDNFICKLEFKDGHYWAECPVLLSHNNMGFSIGGSSKKICSICGENLFECNHIKGKIYNKIKAKRVLDYCNICVKRECNHIEGNEYDNVKAIGVVTDIDLDHIALVDNPANPLCRITSMNVPKSDLIKSLPENEKDKFIYGETIIFCNHCIECNGE